jgi:hypothetical protein
MHGDCCGSDGYVRQLLAYSMMLENCRDQRRHFAARLRHRILLDGRELIAKIPFTKKHYNANRAHIPGRNCIDSEVSHV